MLTLGIRRNRDLPLLRNFRQLAPPCLLIILVGIFGVVQKKTSLTSVNRGDTQFALGATVSGYDLPKNRVYIHYTIRETGERYWLSSIANRFRVAGGWRKIAETTLKHQGKGSTDKEVSDSQYRLEVGQEVLIPL